MGLPFSLFEPWETPVCSLSTMAQDFWRLHLFRNNKEEKKETKKNSPGYLSLSCASLGTWELPALSRIVVSSRRHRNLISRGANSLRPSLGCTCFRPDQPLASASPESAIFCAPLLVVLGACPLSRRFSQSCFFCQFLPLRFGYVCVCDV